MGIGILLNGRIKPRFLRRTPQPLDCLTRIRQLAAAHWGADLRLSHLISRPHPQLCLDVHPAAPWLIIESQVRGELTFDAQTNCVGPGFHHHVCEFLHAIARELQATWRPVSEEEPGDEAGYLESGDPDQLRAEMTAWLGAVLQSVQASPPLKSDDSRALSMNVTPIFKHPARIQTQLGPLSLERFAAIARNPTAGAADFFPWNDFDRNGRYYLNRALVYMWLHVRWQSPLSSESRDVQAEVLRCLREAHRLDGTLPVPWREWHELLAWHDATPTEREVVHRAMTSLSNEPHEPIGYRRFDVYDGHNFGFSIRIPGAFEVDSPGEHDDWRAFDENDSVSISTLQVTAEDGSPAPADTLLANGRNKAGAGPLIEWTSEGEAAFAIVSKEPHPSGGINTLLSGRIARDGKFAIFAVESGPRGRGELWAVEAAKSLRLAKHVA